MSLATPGGTAVHTTARMVHNPARTDTEIDGNANTTDHAGPPLHGGRKTRDGN